MFCGTALISTINVFQGTKYLAMSELGQLHHHVCKMGQPPCVTDKKRQPVHSKSCRDVEDMEQKTIIIHNC